MLSWQSCKSKRQVKPNSTAKIFVTAEAIHIGKKLELTKSSPFSVSLHLFVAFNFQNLYDFSIISKNYFFKSLQADIICIG